MSSLPNLPLLKFNENTLEEVRKEIGLDSPERIEEAVNILEDWIKKQSHFMKKDLPRDLLEKVIVASKGLLERAKVRLEKYYTYRTTMPDYFRHDNFEELRNSLKSFVTHVHVPKMTPENYRIHITKLLSTDGDSVLLYKYYQYILNISEYIKAHDYPAGFVLIIDYREISIASLLTKVNLMEFRQFMTILMEGYGMRVKAMHMITPSKTIDSLISLAKTVLSDKIIKRIHVHKTLDSLYNHVDKDSFPVEYGGKERPMKDIEADWFKIMISDEFQCYLNELDNAKINESYRQTAKFNEDYIGMPGSFRTLVVD